jgi:hypothetical protein
MTKCNKISFHSQLEAANYIKFLNGQPKKNKGHLKKLRTYYCWYCKEWHLTSQTKHSANVVRRKKREDRESEKPSDD